LTITADEAVANRAGDAYKSANAREIDEFLRNLLSSGKRPSKEVFDDGKQNGYSQKQLHTASKRVGVRKFNTGGSATKR
jgi:hypothetical protein